jgi:flagellar biosynthetic protein FlhB
LYKLVEPGQSIPFELYAAVAGILAYLYRQKVQERVRRDRQAKEREQKAQQRIGRADWSGNAGVMGTVALREFGGGM